MFNRELMNKIWCRGYDALLMWPKVFVTMFAPENPARPLHLLVAYDVNSMVPSWHKLIPAILYLYRHKYNKYITMNWSNPYFYGEM